MGPSDIFLARNIELTLPLSTWRQRLHDFHEVHLQGYQLLSRNVERFRGLVFKAHTLLYHSTLSSRVIKKKKKKNSTHTGTLLMRKRTPLGPYSRPMPGVLGGPGGVGVFK